MSKRYYQGKRYYTKNTVTDLVLLNHTMVISLFCLLTSSTVPTEVAPVLNYLSYLTLRNSGYLSSPFSSVNKHR